MPRPAPRRRRPPAQYAPLPEILSAYQHRAITFAQAADEVARCFAERRDDPVGNAPFPYRLKCLNCGAEFESVIHPLVNTECCSDECLRWMLEQNFGAFTKRVVENHHLLAVIVTELLVAPSLDPNVLAYRTDGHADLIYQHVWLLLNKNRG